jgi:hypothetical protein
MPIAAILALLPSVISGVQSTIEYIKKVRETAKQTGEWPQEIEDQFQASIDAMSDDPAWKPDNADGTRG